jgi:hypothetical protein
MSNLTKYADFSIEDAEEAEEELAKLGSADFFKPASGKNVVRFLPAKAGQKTFVTVQQHFVDMPGGKAVSFVCPRIHAKRPCPACTKADKLRATGNPNDEQAARKLMPNLRVYAGIVDRKNPEAGVRVFPFGKQVYEQLLAIRKNEEGGGNFVDPGPQGFDIVIEKSGTGLNTEYKVLPARKESPLGNDEWLDNLPDLARYGRVDSEEELQKRLGGGGRGGRGGGRGGRGGGSGKSASRNIADDTIDLTAEDD